MAVSTLEVLVTGDSTRLTTALNGGAASAKTFEKSVSSVGTSAKSALSSAVPLGAVAAGAALGLAAKKAIDAALDFDRTFTQIASLTDTTGDKVEQMKNDVLSLSGATAVAPNELAHAMYFLASAGLDAQQQADALKVSAEGAAVGLGDAADLARITSIALNGFADQGITATEVMDTLVAAVRVGTAEPDEFANALGRVIPVADQAGISFAQTAASIATMSNAGLDANEGVTALRGTLQALISPTTQSQKALDSIGLSVDDVVNSLQQQGLIGTLRMLDEQAKANTTSTGQYNIVMRNLVPNVRALTGVFNLTSQEAAKVDDNFKAVVQSTGDLSKAMAITEQSPSFKFRQALNELGIIALELGSKVLPALAEALSLIAGPAKILARFLPEIVGAFLAFKAVQYLPVLLGGIANSLTRIGQGLLDVGAQNAASRFAVLGGAAGSASTGLAGLAGALAPIAALAGAAAFGLKALNDSFQAGRAGEAKAQLDAFTGSVQATADQTVNLTDVLSKFNAAGFRNAFGNLPTVDIDTSTIEGARAELGNYVAQLQATDQATNLLSASTADSQLTFAEWLVIADETGKKWGDAVISNDEYIQTLQRMVPQVAKGTISQETWNAALDEANDRGLPEANFLLEKYKAQMAAAAAAAQVTAIRVTKFGEAFNSIIAKGPDVSGILSAMGTDMMTFRSDAIAAAKDGTKAFNDFADKALEDATKAWDDFHSAAVDALTFAPSMLADLESAAESAQQQLAEGTKGLTGDAIANLRSDANLTASEILRVYQNARKQTVAFGRDLLEVSKIGGKAGQDLANSLLEAGDVLGAQVIADAPGKMQKQIVTAFGKSESASDNLSTKLTNAIVGPLKAIERILKKLARAWNIVVKADTDPATASISNLQGKLDGLQRRYGSLDIPVHTHPTSPWPDEALKMHLLDPMRHSGFKKVGGVWTLPLTVGAHSDVSGFGLGTLNSGGHAGGWDTINGALKSFRGIIADVQSPMYAKRWQHDMLAQLKKQGTSDYQRTLIRQAIRDVREATTAHEAKDAAVAFHAAIRRFQMHRNGPRERPADWQPAWYDAAFKGKTSIPVGVGHTRTKLDVRLDRKHFDDNLAYESTYRGWY